MQTASLRYEESGINLKNNKMFKNKLFWKNFLGYIFLLSVCLAFTGYFASKVIKKHQLGLFTKNLESHAALASQLVRTSLPNNDTGKVNQICKILSQYLSIDIVVVSHDGNIMSQSGVIESGGHNLRKDRIDAVLKNKKDMVYYDNRLEIMSIATPVRVSENREFFLIISSSFKAHKIQQASTVKTIILYMVLIFAGAVAIGFVIIKFNTYPLRNIIRIAQNFAQGNFARKVEISSSDEIGELANAINTMGFELQTQMQTILDDNKKLDAIMTHMNDAVIATDLRERIILINQAAKTLFGIPTVAVNKDYLWERIRNEKLCSSVREITKTQGCKTLEIEIASPEKKLLQAHLSSIQIDTTTQGILLVFHDITELRKLENTRKEFVANVSHELRTPLASIKGYVETLHENASIDRKHLQEFLGIIMKHTQRLDDLIKDILELSRLESHDLKTELHDLDIRPCLESISSHYKERCIQKGQTFELQIVDPLPMIETNEYSLRQLLTNLLDNAVKYTPEGGRIGLMVKPVDGSILFEVSDTGIGISKEHIPRIFERFYRVDPARSREMGGTGLGLSIVKHIVNLHHGLIKVESAPGAGSKFIITLPHRGLKQAY